MIGKKGASLVIAVAGAGYVGLSLAVLLAQRNKVFAVDIDERKVNMLKAGQCPFADKDISRFLATKDLDLTPTLDSWTAYRQSDVVIVATPTDYNDAKGSFDMSSVDYVVGKVVQANPDALIVIKSTVALGSTDALQRRYPQAAILFSPEFLREGKALHDNLHPSRIIVGMPDIPENGTSTSGINASERHRVLEGQAWLFAKLLASGAKERCAQLVMKATEAEAVKLFANTYLAMRVAFFNELDTYAEQRGLDSRAIIDGVCLDSRIGLGYNNPSFGYGGYCLPKDTKQLRENYRGIPQQLISAVVEANATRKDYISERINDLCENIQIDECIPQGHGEKPVVGIYRLTMKWGSDNFRSSSLLGVLERMEASGRKVVVYEPAWSVAWPFDAQLVDDLDEFKRMSHLIVANRWDDDLFDVREKVYTRDLFERD